MDDMLYLFLQTKKSAGTRKNYESVIRNVEKQFKKPFTSFTAEDAEDFISYYRGQVADKVLTPATFKYRLCILRSYGHFLQTNVEGYVSPFADTAVPRVSSNVQILKTPTLTECDALLSALPEEGDEFLIFALALRCGFSVKTLCEMRISSFFEQDGALYYHEMSEKADRVIYIPSDMAPLLLSRIQTQKSGHLFVNQRGKPFATRTMRNRISRVLAMHQMDYTLGDFRNRGILEMMAAGAMEENVAEYVGLTPNRLSHFHSALSGIGNAPCEMSRVRIVSGTQQKG